MDPQVYSNFYSKIQKYLSTNVELDNWILWIFILLFILFLLWLFFGGGNYEYIGLKPLRVGVDSTKYINSENYYQINREHKQREIQKEIEKEIEREIEKEILVKNQQKNNQKEENKENFIPSSDSDSSKNIKKYSKGEEICRQVLEEVYKKEFPCVRPNFLKNPETKRNLELDCYNDELKLAVEYNGIQHYKWPNFTGQTKEQFINQIRRDKFKVEACDKNGVYLITVPYTVSHDKIRDYIMYYLPENYNQRTRNEGNVSFIQSEDSIEISELDVSSSEE